MKALVTGSAGMLGSALVNALEAQAGVDVFAATRADADLRSREDVNALIDRVQPDIVMHAAARVGGIAANLADNVGIDRNVIEASADREVGKLIYFGSSCMYPRDYRQPLVESDILAAPLEPTNEGYALAKIVGSRMCDYVSRERGLAYRTLIPSNLYGPGDHFGSTASHLVAAAIYKVDQACRSGASSIDVWGDGTARREFTYVADVADWVAESLEDVGDWPSLLNIGLGVDYSVREFYEFALKAVGYEAELVFDVEKPAGMRQKLMDSTRAKQHGWNPGTSIEQGMAVAYASYLSSLAEEDGRG